MTSNTKYICDTNVLLSSLLSKSSPPNAVVRFINRNGVFAFSSETFAEFEEVLNRPKFDKFLSKKERDIFLENIKSLAVFYTPSQKVDICRDPKDNKFLDVAIASYADFIVTGDEDLLVLESIGNTSIITPRKFVEIFS